MSNVFPVRIKGIEYSPADQSNDNIDWLKALSLAHRQDHTFCLCNQPKKIPLSVKLYGRDTPGMHYGLARWPDTGIDHDIDCRFFGDESGSTNPDEALPAFVDLGEGKYRAHLATALKIIEGRIQQIEAKKRRDGSSVSRARASETALLLKLWRTANLNVYRKPRSWFSASYSIVHAAQKIVVSRTGATLADHLLIASNLHDRLATSHNEEVLAAANTAPTRLFVIARMKAFKRDKPQILFPTPDFALLPKILVQIDQLDKFLHGRDLMKNLMIDRSGNVVALLCIEPAGADWWKVVTIAGVSTDLNFIPVESSYEIEFSNYLAQQSRKFLKPLVVGEDDASGSRPDFVLLDTPDRVVCEVWGMQTPEYLTSKRRRLEGYTRSGQNLVSWSANLREPLPALPAPVAAKD